MDESERGYDERKIRLGLLMMGVALVLAVVLLIVVNDPIGRFIFGFVALACLVQLWRLGRLMRRLQ
jgi:Flp pilus assembly protein TadB